MRILLGLLFSCYLLPNLAFGQLPLTLLVQETEMISCADSTDAEASANVFGGMMPYTYTWSNGETTPVISDLGPGTYTVTVTDGDTTIIKSINITAPPLLTLTVDSTELSNCSSTNGEANAIPIGGGGTFAYNWSNGETIGNITGLMSGTYAVTVTDNRGCSISDSTFIPLTGGPPQLSSTSTNISCYLDNDGSIDITAIGGTPPYSYNWTPSSTQEDLSGLSPGFYTVLVTDFANCIVSTSVEITSPTQLNLSVFATPSSATGMNGSVTANGSGGVPPYEFVWDFGDTAQIVNGLAPGTYEVTITDANGCSNTGQAGVDVFVSDYTLSEVLNINISPNPNAGSFWIEMDNPEQIEMQISMLDPLGKTIWSTTHSDSFFRNEINEGHLANGLYFLRFQSSQGALTEKILIHR